MSSYSPCLLPDKDKLSHSSLRQTHKTVTYNVISVVLAKVLFIQNTTGSTVTQWGLKPTHSDLSKAAWQAEAMLMASEISR